jgi:transcriptional regulator with XRE-family HTH domain
MGKTFLSQNLRYLRKSDSRKPTQSDMASLLGVSISTYGAYEEGRAEPKLENLQKITGFFGIEAEALISKDLSAGTDAKKNEGYSSSIPGNSRKPFPEILAITVDPEGNNNIEWVPEKAAAGYTSGYADPDFVSALPAFRLPFLDKNRKFRVFTIKGDSMLPIPSGSQVFGEYAENWYALKDQTICILITRNDGIVFKKLYNYLSLQSCFLLVSTNPEYEPYLIPASEVLEIWKFSGYFSREFPG